MHRRQPLPRLWMMTDERQGEGLWTALDRLPRWAGVVFRHYSLGESDRRRLFADMRAIAEPKGLLLLLAGPPELAKAWGADGAHGRFRNPPGMILTTPAHNLVEIRAAERAGANLLFLSPAYPTRSHPARSRSGCRGWDVSRVGRVCR